MSFFRKGKSSTNHTSDKDRPKAPKYLIRIQIGKVTGVLPGISYSVTCEKGHRAESTHVEKSNADQNASADSKGCHVDFGGESVHAMIRADNPSCVLTLYAGPKAIAEGLLEVNAYLGDEGSRVPVGIGLAVMDASHGNRSVTIHAMLWCIPQKNPDKSLPIDLKTVEAFLDKRTVSEREKAHQVAAKLSAANRSLEEEKRKLENDVTSIRTDLDDTAAARDELRATVQSLLDENLGLREDCEASADKIRRLEAKLTDTPRTPGLSDRVSQDDDDDGSVGSLRAQNRVLKRQIAAHSKALHESEQNNSRLLLENASLRTRIAELERKHTEAVMEARALKREIKSTEDNRKEGRRHSLSPKETNAPASSHTQGGRPTAVAAPAHVPPGRAQTGAASRRFGDPPTAERGRPRTRATEDMEARVSKRRPKSEPRTRPLEAQKSLESVVDRLYTEAEVKRQRVQEKLAEALKETNELSNRGIRRRLSKEEQKHQAEKLCNTQMLQRQRTRDDAASRAREMEDRLLNKRSKSAPRSANMEYINGLFQEAARRDSFRAKQEQQKSKRDTLTANRGAVRKLSSNEQSKSLTWLYDHSIETKENKVKEVREAVERETQRRVDQTRFHKKKIKIPSDEDFRSTKEGERLQSYLNSRRAKLEKREQTILKKTQQENLELEKMRKRVHLSPQDRQSTFDRLYHTKTVSTAAASVPPHTLRSNSASSMRSSSTVAGQSITDQSKSAAASGARSTSAQKVRDPRTHVRTPAHTPSPPQHTHTHNDADVAPPRDGSDGHRGSRVHAQPNYLRPTSASRARAESLEGSTATKSRPQEATSGAHPEAAQSHTRRQQRSSSVSSKDEVRRTHSAGGRSAAPPTKFVTKSADELRRIASPTYQRSNRHLDTSLPTSGILKKSSDLTRDSRHNMDDEAEAWAENHGRHMGEEYGYEYEYDIDEAAALPPERSEGDLYRNLPAAHSDDDYNCYGDGDSDGDGVDDGGRHAGERQSRVKVVAPFSDSDSEPGEPKGGPRATVASQRWADPVAVSSAAVDSTTMRAQLLRDHDVDPSDMELFSTNSQNHLPPASYEQLVGIASSSAGPVVHGSDHGDFSGHVEDVGPHPSVGDTMDNLEDVLDDHFDSPGATKNAARLVAQALVSAQEEEDVP